MNNADKNKEANRKFKFEIGRTVTFGLPIFVLLYILGMFITPLAWVWHFPPLITFLSSMAIGCILNWLVFKLYSSAKRA